MSRHNSGVLVSVLASSVVDREFEPRWLASSAVDREFEPRWLASSVVDRGFEPRWENWYLLILL
jgi:hypothetical protein